MDEKHFEVLYHQTFSMLWAALAASGGQLFIPDLALDRMDPQTAEIEVQRSALGGVYIRAKMKEDRYAKRTMDPVEPLPMAPVADHGTLSEVETPIWRRLLAEKN